MCSECLWSTKVPLQFTLKWAWRKEPSHWRVVSYTFTSIHFTHELSTWELEVFTRLTTRSWHLMEWLWQDLGHFGQALSQEPKLPPWARLRMLWGQALILLAQANGLSSILWLVIYASLITQYHFPPWYLTLSMAALHLDWSSSQ